jgi:3D (Asp-Asp-Asp) domain-containing protein
MWVELDEAWGFSAYPALDLSQYPPSTEQYEVSDWNSPEPALLPSNWIINPSDPTSSIQMQGSGVLPPDYYEGRVVRWNMGQPEITDHHIRGGRTGRYIENLSYKAVAAPAEFPNQALLFVPGLQTVNPEGLLSVEDSGGQITLNNKRIDVFVGVMTAYEAIVASSRWGGWENPQTVFVLVDLPQATWTRVPSPSSLYGFFPSPMLEGLGECYLPETIEGVHIRAGAGAVIQ